jgi:hypothetical protein
MKKKPPQVNQSRGDAKTAARWAEEMRKRREQRELKQKAAAQEMKK